MPGSEPTSQTKNLADALREPSCYPHSPDHVREIQTHISWVFIAPPFVYKVKKPLDLGFLDFRTLESRKHFCEQEVRLNRRLCPDVYLGVVPISESDGGYVLSDESNIVDYAVKMRELSGGIFALDLVESSELTEQHVDRIVAKLADFYREESSSPEVASWGRIENLRVSTDENFEQTETFADSLLSRPAFDAIRFYTDRFYDGHAQLFNRRRAEGRILDCHGDLHLEHVYLTEDATCIYDCIEFSDRLRRIDVANDTAFLAMDLDFHGRRSLANYFIEQISIALDDPELVKLVDFYKCYRAYVRAKVRSMQSIEEEVPADDRAESRRRAQRYYQLALRYAVAGSSPAVFVMMGRVGTGKSSVANRLAEALGWEHLSSDLIRKTQAGADPYRHGSEAEREDLYTKQRTEETYAAITNAALGHCADGRGCVVDATYSRKSHRDALRDALIRENIPYCFLETTASDETLKERLAARDGKKVVSDARLEDFGFLTSFYEAPDDLEDAFHVRISTEQPLEGTLKQALYELIRIDLASLERDAVAT